MKRRRALAAFLVGLVGLAAGAPDLAGARERVVTAAHKNLIEIDLAYRGDKIYFFGLNPDPLASLILKLSSLHGDHSLLSLAGQVGPFWLTVKQYALSGPPLVYKVHSRQPLAEVLSPELAQQLELGYPSLALRLRLELLKGRAEESDRAAAWAGFLRLKEAANLYRIVEDPGRMELIEGLLYKDHFTFPPQANEGSYVVETYAVRDKTLLGYGRQVVEVRKTGLQSWLTTTAHQRPWVYGLLAVLTAAVLGLAVGLVFNRGGHH